MTPPRGVNSAQLPACGPAPGGAPWGGQTTAGERGRGEGGGGGEETRETTLRLDHEVTASSPRQAPVTEIACKAAASSTQTDCLQNHITPEVPLDRGVHFLLLPALQSQGGLVTVLCQSIRLLLLQALPSQRVVPVFCQGHRLHLLPLRALPSQGVVKSFC